MEDNGHGAFYKNKLFLVLMLVAAAGLVLIGLGGGAETGSEQGWFQWLLTIGQRKLSLVVVLLVLALATMLSEDLTCIAAGLLAAQGVVSAGQAIAACFAGIWLGDMFMYALGRYIGRAVMQRAPLKWVLHPAMLEASQAWLHRVGLPAILLARFIPGSRNPVFVAAGALELPFFRVALGCALAAMVWVPFLTLMAMHVGGRALEYLELWGQASGISIVLAAVLVWLVARVVLPVFRLVGRRFPSDALGRWLGPVGRLLFLVPPPAASQSPSAAPPPPEGRVIFARGGAGQAGTPSPAFRRHKKRRKPRQRVPASRRILPRRSGRAVVNRLALRRRRGFGGPMFGRSFRCNA